LVDVRGDVRVPPGEKTGGLIHIAAISRRKGELERGYPNLNSYSGWRLAPGKEKSGSRTPFIKAGGQ
jgi:hypothetical protein